MFKHKSNKQNTCFNEKQPPGLCMNINRAPSPKIGIQFKNGRRKPSISRKIEEKCIYKISNQSRERSQSLRNLRKKREEQIINDQYKTNRIRRVYEKQQQLPNHQCEEYLELKCNSRQKQQKNIGEIQSPKIRLKRVRSNDSFTKNRSDKIRQNFSKKALNSLKETNAFLKQAYSQSQKKIEQLQSQKNQEKQHFQTQKLMYQKQIDAIKNRINKNKVQIGHLFSYQAFDPFKVAVKPIIEVEEYSSLMHSLYTTNKKSVSNKKDSQYGLFEKLTKNHTETTCMHSIEDYNNIDVR